MGHMPNRNPSDAVELELIRSLAPSLMPTSIMTAGFAFAGGLIVWTERDPMLLGLFIAGLVASAARIIAALRLPRRDGGPYPIERAQRREHQFRSAYIAFAMALGLFGLRTFLIDSPTVQVLMVCLLMGYAAGVAATVALRPSIAIPSMLAALTPMIAASLLSLNPIYMAVGLMTAAFFVGGVQNLRARHSHVVEQIELKITFANIARKDSLTALPNRVALREWFQDRRRSSASGKVAVLYLDLDGFKPINDRHGHIVGDAVLSAVGKRIAGTIRDSDIAARLGGDEFAVVQFGVEDEDAAGHLAQRLSEAIGRPYQIENRTVRVAASIGYVVMEPAGRDLEHLLNLADQALYGSKRQGGGVTRYEDARALNAA